MTAGRQLTRAEWIAVALLAVPMAMVLGAYVLDLAGLRFAPVPMLLLSLAAAGVVYRGRPARTDDDRADVALFLLVIVAISGWLLWLAWPTLLPLSTGPDLTHHLILIRYIEEHWRLVHDPSVEHLLGEMAQYTPGSHVIAALAGAWSGADGLRALHPVQAVCVGLESGFLLLIVRRMVPSIAPRLLALAAVVLLFASPRYFVGGFTEYGFVAQVVAQLFVVSMWWATVAWDQAPGWAPDLVFASAGAAAFLSWPVYSGPPALAMFLVIAVRPELSVRSRVMHLLTAFGPLTVCALSYLAGRLAWLGLAGTGGAAPWPSIASYSSLLVSLATLGFILALTIRRARPTALFVCAVLVQSGVFYVLARRNGAPQPYMALKMFYLLLWPMAACAALAISEVWTRFLAGRLPAASSTPLAGAVIAVLMVAVARPLARRPDALHPLPPAVSLPLYEAGKWARANLPAHCIEYLVGDDETAYWLHLAVLGNPRMWERTGNNSTYEASDAVLRWLTPGGLPFAIADLKALSRDVREELDIVQEFGTAAIAKRRGPASCGEQP
jgi:hypothetical protein